MTAIPHPSHHTSARFLLQALSLLPAAAAAYAVVAIRLGRQRRRLRRSLATLTEVEREAVLAPLRYSLTGTTRRLAEYLSSDAAGDPGCVTPAAAPNGRGTEVAAE